MYKYDFVDKISEKTGLTKKDVMVVIEAYNDTVIEALKNRDSIALKGFGTFTTSIRKARTGRNPQTGEVLHIAEAVVPKFSPSKNFKEAVNEKQEG